MVHSDKTTDLIQYFRYNGIWRTITIYVIVTVHDDDDKFCLSVDLSESTPVANGYSSQNENSEM